MMQPTQIDLIFSGLANPIRRDILARLMGGAKSVGELSQPLSISAPAISRHLKILEEANLIRYEKHNQFRMYSLNEDGFAKTFEYIEQYRQYWNQQFDALDEQLQQRKPNDE